MRISADHTSTSIQRVANSLVGYEVRQPSILPVTAGVSPLPCVPPMVVERVGWAVGQHLEHVSSSFEPQETLEHKISCGRPCAGVVDVIRYPAPVIWQPSRL